MVRMVEAGGTSLRFVPQVFVSEEPELCHVRACSDPDLEAATFVYFAFTNQKS